MGEATFGKYRLIAELGHGGMADVFLAVQAGPAGSGFHKLSVIKRLRQNLVEEPEFVEMLIEEARIAARLNHPNVVQTNEVGQVGQQYFIAMEYLDGQPLHRIQHRSSQRLKEGKTSPIAQAQQMIIVMDALAGLHHAHELSDYDGSPLQIVHRDVTPQNIFVTYEGQVKVVDFGIAKAAGRASETRQGVVKGKVRYMAPEQALGQAVDRRADVFSIGIMLWEVAASRRLWKDVDDLEIVRQLIEGAYPASPRLIDPTVPEGLDRICQKALAQDREDRYASCDDFRLDLEQYLADSGELVDGRRKLAPGVSELFQDKRNEIKAVIEKQLVALGGKPTGEFSAVRLGPDSASNTTPFAQTISSGPSTAFDAVELPSPEPVRTTPRRLLNRFTTAAVAIALAGAIGAVAWRTTTPRAAASLELPAAAEISVRLRAVPEGARISIDDGPPRAAPVEVRVRKDTRTHVIRFEADGHVPRTETVRFAVDLSMTISLVALHVKPTETAKAPPPTVAAAHQPGQPALAAGRPVAAPPPVSQPVGEAAPGPAVAAAPPANAEMPASKKPKPRTELDNGDPWANK